MSMTPKSSERTAQILEAAAQLFARQGYHGTSTREIARLADSSENTLFRHFANKEDIFWAALRARFSGIQPRRELLESIRAGLPPDVVVPQLLAQLVDAIILRPDLPRLIAVAFLELRWKAEEVCQEFLQPVLSLVNDYLAAGIERGQVKRLDPAMVTTALASTVILHPELARLTGGARPPLADSAEVIKAYSRFWVEVLSPSAHERVSAA